MAKMQRKQRKVRAAAGAEVVSNGQMTAPESHHHEAEPREWAMIAPLLNGLTKCADSARRMCFVTGSAAFISQEQPEPVRDDYGADVRDYLVDERKRGNALAATEGRGNRKMLQKLRRER